MQRWVCCGCCMKSLSRPLPLPQNANYIGFKALYEERFIIGILTDMNFI